MEATEVAAVLAFHGRQPIVLSYVCHCANSRVLTDASRVAPANQGPVRVCWLGIWTRKFIKVAQNNCAKIAFHKIVIFRGGGVHRQRSMDCTLSGIRFYCVNIYKIKRYMHPYLQ